jgi:ABC-type sugar transport system ATPase subunit
LTVLLTARDIHKHFEATQALSGVDLSIEAGAVHALVGENGAGKSTLSKILAGVVQPDSGEILWDGTPIHLTNPMEAQRKGIGMIFQELDLFPHLTIAGNLTIGNLAAESGALLRPRELDAFCRPLLREVGLDAPPGKLVVELSIGQTQLVAIARALGMNARLLIMDEPTSALGEDSAEKLFDLIVRLKQRGVAILYVSHKMDEIFRLSDRITVLRDGAVINSLPTSETSIGEIIAMMVGRDLASTPERPEPHAAADLLLRVEQLSSRKLRNVSFDLHAGEVLGVAGLVGSGRSSLGAALFGLDPSVSGRIEVRGQRYVPRSPADAIRSGIGLVPEDRKALGLMMQMSVEENSTISILDRLQSFGFLRRSHEAADVIRRLRIKTPSAGSVVSTLSGGNQQKVLLARWLLAKPSILILDDPTRGVDIGAKHDIYEVIRSLAAAGVGIILMSSELQELLLCSDRILVLHEGQQAGIVDRGATQERIMSLATRV